jgi:hypothetical protein
LSAVRAKYIAATDNVVTAKNASLELALFDTLDSVDMVVTHLAAMEQFVHLHIPRMEDGNNFGVTVQLSVLKQMSDTQERLAKAADDLYKYASARADALEKCKLTNSTTSVSKSTSETGTEGTSAEKGNVNGSEKKQSLENKTVETATTLAESAFRMDAVVAVDLAYYVKSKALFQLAMTSLLAILDFCEKNQDRLAEPKGSQGSAPAYTGMY